MTTRKETVFGRLLVWLEHLASRRLGAFVLFGIGLAVYAVRAIAWPLKTGRDLDEYLYAYVQLFDRHVLLPWSLLFRTPVTPLVAGAALDVLDGRLAEPLMAVLYAGSIVCWAAAARFFGPRAAIAVAVALLAYTGYALMFHELSSEPVFAAAFAGWALLVTRATFAPSAGRFALVGLGVAVLALVRPGKCRSTRLRHRAVARRRHLASPAEPDGRVRARRARPAACLVRAQRAALRLLGARARRQRDHPVLPGLHHRPHRLALER